LDLSVIFSTHGQAPGRGKTVTTEGTLRGSGEKIWVRKFSSFDDENRADRELWQRMTPDERVAIVEQLREEWWKHHGNGEEGLRRAVRVLETA
jgi:hypothetical protein